MLFEHSRHDLYYLGQDGKMRIWTISVEGNYLVIHHGHLNGQMQTTTEEIVIGKGGRSVFQQIESRVQSRINKQKLKGYKESIAEAAKGPTNALGLSKPMLAQPINKVKKIDFTNAIIQYKYDGHRCLITNQDGELKAYSRNGKYIKTISHILDDINIAPGVTLDGELYAHGATLQQISSWAKRDTPIPQTKNLRFHCYDILTPDPYRVRKEFLEDIILGETAEVVPMWDYINEKYLKQTFNNAREDGYEGLIVRLDGFGYEDAKRSKSLLKVKQFFDTEVQIFGFYRSDRGNVPMIKCIFTNGKQFDVVAPGSKHEKEIALANPTIYLNKLLTVEYSTITKDGVPFQPVAKGWRDDL